MSRDSFGISLQELAHGSAKPNTLGRYGQIRSFSFVPVSTAAAFISHEVGSKR